MNNMELTDGSRIGIIGGGPAGSMTAYFMLKMAELIDLKLEIDIYEPRDYSRSGPVACNMCGGIVSESLVQLLATEGINIPASVVERGIDSYVLHSNQDEVHIATPLEEQRIAAMFRASGPKGAEGGKWDSFDGFLLKLACDKGAKHIQQRVSSIEWKEGYPVFHTKSGDKQRYELLVGAVGVNPAGLKLFKNMGFGYEKPKTADAYICELHLGREIIQKHLGNSMHCFLLDIPNLDFAALIPKGEYVTVCILGSKVDKQLIRAFLTSPEVRACLPAGWDPESHACQCKPSINVGMAKNFFADRVVLVGDCGVSKLYKDGIGAAYKTSKACAITTVFHGVSKESFEKIFGSLCTKMERDNLIGKFIFLVVAVFRKLAFLRRGMMRMTHKEQSLAPDKRAMSGVLWDTFTGSAPYVDVFMRTLRPAYLFRLTLECTMALFGFSQKKGKN